MIFKNYLSRKKINKWRDSLIRAIIKYSDFFFVKKFILSMAAFDPRILNYIDDPDDYKKSVSFIVNIDDRLDVAWKDCDFSKFEEVYSLNAIKANVRNALRFFYLKSDYLKFDECMKANSIGDKDLCKLYCHLILCYEPTEFYKKVGEIRLKIQSPKFEMVKELYYSGCVKEAEQYRMSVVGSGHYQVTEYNQGNLDADYKEIVYGGIKLIFIPEQGVGDEVRWSRLYRHLDYSNVTFACDERLTLIYKDYLKNAKLLPIKSLYTSRGNIKTTVQEVVKALGNGRSLDSYDFIYTNCFLFSILPKYLIATNQQSFLSKTLLTKAGKIKVGVAWSSVVRNPMRLSRYGLPLNEIVVILQVYIDKIDFYAIQSGMTKEEETLCRASGIRIVDGLDFYNDFKSSADFYSSLDAVVGVSTLNTELAAAFGPRFYHIANAPDIFYMRTGSLNDGCYNSNNHTDQLSSNTKTIGPRVGYQKDKALINKSCFEHALDEILQDFNCCDKVRD